MPSPSTVAWLETPAGQRYDVAGNFSFGRSADNQCVILSARVSRRHAVIHAQEGEHWLADLGSTNGTALNGHRLLRPTRLKQGDTISIADLMVTFHETEKAVDDDDLASYDMTVVDVRTVPCWLLVADIADFTTLSQEVAPEALAVRVGLWIRHCREQIEQNGGVINKYLGDGFIAYWRGAEEMASQLAATLKGLQEVRRGAEMKFRVVLHQGSVSLGGGASHAEESLMGPAVNYAFRMEKAAASEGVDFCVSPAAEKHLAALLPLTPMAGEHELKGFSGRHRFFAVAG